MCNSKTDVEVQGSRPVSVDTNMYQEMSDFYCETAFSNTAFSEALARGSIVVCDETEPSALGNYFDSSRDYF